MEVEELFLFKAFIVEIKTHEALNKSSQFTASFQQIEDDINYEISNIQQLVSKRAIIRKKYLLLLFQ